MANPKGSDKASSRDERRSGGSNSSADAGTATAGSLGDAGQGPSTTGGLASGYSSRSANGGTGGDVLKQKGSGYSPGTDSREGAYENEADPLAREGVTGGAAGMEPSARALDQVPMSGREEEAYRGNPRILVAAAAFGAIATRVRQPFRRGSRAPSRR